MPTVATIDVKRMSPTGLWRGKSYHHIVPRTGKTGGWACRRIGEGVDDCVGKVLFEIVRYLIRQMQHGRRTAAFVFSQWTAQFAGTESAAVIGD